MGPGDLAQALGDLQLGHHPDLLVGMESGDDAGVYRLSDDLALVLTLDFFTPIVDDPVLFGEIAAANALSDVYAMGARPLCALNIVAFPVKRLAIEILKQVLQGGLNKLREAGIPLVGGHSIDDNELKYGLSVTGTVHPDRIWTNGGARAGDQLILTKPLGTGVVSTAIKRGKASPSAADAATQSMATLNQKASDWLAQNADVHACTDVTGFGFLGHLSEMIQSSALGVTITASDIPLLPEALRYAEQSCTPGGLTRNRLHRAPSVDMHPSLPAALADLLYDPQTSGGLLAALPAMQAAPIARQLVDQGINAAVVGEFTQQARGRIVVN